MILTFKAKVLLESEDQMELQGKYDLGDIIDKYKKWVWKNIAIPSEEIFRLIEYNSNKTLIKMYDEELVMVAEPFESVFKKWEEARLVDRGVGEEVEEEEQEAQNDTSKDEE